MLSAVWLMLSTLLYSLELSTGSFPKPLSEAEEQHYLVRLLVWQAAHYRNGHPDEI